MKLKKGVRIHNLVPQMALACYIVEGVYRRLQTWYECTLTSADDGVHGPRTLHGQGRAIDFRTKDFNGNKYQLRNEVSAALGDDFDVVLEDMHGPQEHLHVEWDPK